METFLPVICILAGIKLQLQLKRLMFFVFHYLFTDPNVCQQIVFRKQPLANVAAFHSRTIS